MLGDQRGLPGEELGSPAPLVTMRDIVKEFPGVRANDGVNFELRPGEVHALLGENGAGKSTLMHMLAGMTRPTAGVIKLNGHAVELGSPKAAIERRIGMVHQHFRLVERFTVAENVTLGWHTPRRLITPRALEKEIGRLSRELEIAVAPSRLVWQLSVGEQQRVEILKNLYRGARVLILDEPTAVLTPQEADLLFASMRQMARDGRGVIFISHKLDEVTAVADRVTVLSRGRNVATLGTAETSAAELARLMIGRDLPERRRPADRGAGDTVLRLEGVQADDSRGLRALRGIDLQVRAGEIVGVAGVSGNGQRELAEVIVGLRPLAQGKVVLRGRDVSRWSVRRRCEAGVAYSPEDRQREGLAGALSIGDNLCGRRYRELGLRERRSFAQDLLVRYDVRGADLTTPVSSLSGGNAQKVLLARELSTDPWLMVAAQPTRGLDLGAAEAARQLLVDLRDAGKAVLLISEDLDELVTTSDRIVVIYEGQLMGELPSERADIEQLGLLMAGKQAA
jgi:simple sugar transport system ATP-binding protein